MRELSKSLKVDGTANMKNLCKRIIILQELFISHLFKVGNGNNFRLFHYN